MPCRYLLCRAGRYVLFRGFVDNFCSPAAGLSLRQTRVVKRHYMVGAARQLAHLQSSGIKHQPNGPVSFPQLEQTVHFQTTKLTHSLKKLITPVISGMAALASQLAHAGPALPWDGPITTVVNNLTGPVATGISTVAFLAAGAALIFGGDDLGGIAKKLLYVVLGVALIVFGANFLSMIGLVNSGTLI